MKIKIDGIKFDFFNGFRVSSTYDSVASTFAFLARYDKDNPVHRRIFKPLSYQPIQVFDDNNNLLLTGTVINHEFTSGSTPTLIKISGYSTAGVLEDCNIAYDQYPLESNSKTLIEIASKLLRPFGVGFAVDRAAQNDANLQYKKSVAQVSQTVKDYLAQLTSQRNIVLSHTADGKIAFLKPSFAGAAKKRFTAQNSQSMGLKVAGQRVHNKIWVLRQSTFEESSVSQFDTIDNDFVGGYRPAVKKLTSGIETDSAKAVKNLRSSELKNISVEVTTNSLDYSLQCGDVVEVQNDEIQLYQPTRFVIARKTLLRNESSQSTSYSLVIPETYTGENAKNIFE